MHNLIRSILVLALISLAVGGITIHALTPCTLQITEIRAEKFPDVYLTVRAWDDQGFAIKGLENDFQIEESTSLATSLQKPDVTRNDLKGAPVAVSIILDTRNHTDVTQLTNAREFALQVVMGLNDIVPLGKEGSDFVALWAPTLSLSAPAVSWEEGTLYTLSEVINQKVFPSPETSEGLDLLIRDLIERPTPGNAPHIILVVGKVAQVHPVIDTTMLHGAALQQPHSVLLYTAGVSGSDENYLRQLATASYVPANQGNGAVVVHDILSRFKGEYTLHYRSELIPIEGERKVKLSAAGDIVCSDVERTFTLPPVVEMPATRSQTMLLLLLLSGLTLVGILAWLYTAWIFGAIRKR